MNKKSILLFGILILNILLFIPPIKAGVDYDHRRETDYGYSSQLMHLREGEILHWEYSTILEEFKVRVRIVQPIDHPDPDIVWFESENKTADYGVFIAPEADYYWFYFFNVEAPNKTGYIIIDFYSDDYPSSNVEALWNYYVLPENRTSILWEWESRDNSIEQYYAVECHFQATEYDYFLIACYPYIAPILLLSQAGLDKFLINKDPYDSSIGAIYLQQIDVIRPKHNDTWYFVFMNGYVEEGVSINVSIKYTPNYYGFHSSPPDPDPNPNPDPTPNPDDLTTFLIVISFLVGFTALGLTGGLVLVKKRKNTKKELDKFENDTDEGIFRS